MKEQDLQNIIADYFRMQYPGAIFHSDFGAGIKLTPGQAVRQKRQNIGERGYPDIFIAEPTEISENGRIIGMGYYGLFVELKRDGVRLKKKNGEWATTHIAEQAEMLERLNRRGYLAKFAVGFDEAKEIIDDYMEDSIYNKRKNAFCNIGKETDGK